MAADRTLVSGVEIITNLSGGDILIFIDVKVWHNLRPVISKSFLTLHWTDAGLHRYAAGPPLPTSGI